MLISRRGFIFGAGATLAVIRTPSLLMPIKSLSVDTSRLPYPLPPGTYNVIMLDSLTRLDEFKRCPRKLWIEFKVVGTDHKFKQEMTL